MFLFGKKNGKKENVWFNDPRGLDDDLQPLVEVDEDGSRIAISPEAEAFLEEEREGNLLWPERFGEREVRQLEADMGSWTAAGQLQLVS